jgi:photosystem II stability/assembly factor-like uncharacterized protein
MLLVVATPVQKHWLLLALFSSMNLAGPTVERSPLVPISPGLNRWASTGPSVSSVTRIVPDFSSEEVVYCVATNSGQGIQVGKVFKTVDGGDRWFPLSLEGVVDVAIDPSDSGVLLAASAGSPSIVFKSTDAGVTWSPRTTAASVFGAKRILWDGGRPNRVFLLAFNAVMRSLDAGGSWDLLTPAPPGDVTALALDSTSGALHAASSVGVLRLDVDSSSWVQLSGPFQSFVRELDIDPVRPNVLYALAGGLFTSRDGGRSWTTPDFGALGTPYVSTLVADPLHPDVLFMAGEFATSGVLSSIVRSPDGGVSWDDYTAGLYPPGTLSPLPPVQALALGPARILFAGLQTGLLRRKIDDPAWTPVNNGLPAVPMVRIAVDASSQGLVYAAAGAAVWVSGDAGMTWSFSPGVNIGPTSI